MYWENVIEGWTMKGVTHYILAASNILGLPALIRACTWTDKALVFSIMAASTLMHISETKHELDPPILKDWSYALLNVDRGVALTAGMIFAWKFFQIHYNRQVQVLAVGFLGALCMLLGEIKTSNPTYNNLVYPSLHTIWHASVYYCAYLLV